MTEIEAGRTGIYMMSWVNNSHIYVGSASRSFRKRWSGFDYNEFVVRTVSKYGNPTYTILEYVDDMSTILKREQHFIDLLSPDLNICKIAGSCKGIKLTKEHIEKIRVANTGKKRTEESKKSQSIRMLGSTLTEDHKRKISQSLKGKIVSKETGEKISIAKKGKKFSEEHRQKLREASRRRWSC